VSSPQHFTAPPASAAHACCPPAVSATTPLLKPATEVGWLVLWYVPLPNKHNRVSHRPHRVQTSKRARCVPVAGRNLGSKLHAAS
jgi:hypothetical protein